MCLDCPVLPIPVGTRVWAIQSSDDEIVNAFGWGTFAGFHNPPFEPYNEMPEFLNPRIDLDNGKVVWGCQCWWGEMLQPFEEYLDGRQLIMIDPDTMKPFEGQDEPT